MSRYTLTKRDSLDLLGVRARPVIHRGRRSLELTEDPSPPGGNQHAMAMIRGAVFGDGTIHVRMAGAARADAPAEMRGFVGVAFRVQPGGGVFECIYLRPTNGRADDQLRRNHAVQYDSRPDWPWHRLRQESPGVYESYVDLLPDAWNDVTLRVRGVRAELTVGRARQPCLIVRDLKLGAIRGGIALWIGSGTRACFAGLTVTRQ